MTAYATDEICSDSSVRGNIPVDDAIVGTYTFANLDSQASFGNDAIGLGLDFTGSFTQLPGDGLIPEPQFDKFSIQTFNPEDLDVMICGAPFDGGTTFRPGARFCRSARPIRSVRIGSRA